MGTSVNKDQLSQMLARLVPPDLSRDLVGNFIGLRKDVATRTFGGSAPGKLVETLVQVLQYLERGAYDANPRVDEYLRDLDSRSSSLDPSLRICAARIGRAMYSLRNKRNIAHKGAVDTNVYDLQFLYAGAQWVLSELVRESGIGSMEEAGKLVEQIQLPVSSIVEDFGDRRIVLGDLTCEEEILVLLHSLYPEFVATSRILSSLDRRSPKAVRNALRSLWARKILEGGGREGYKLTLKGHGKAAKILSDKV